ncbi:MAG TPA: flavin reductase family protein [Candidatus Binataceae bacterium]|nr:flavin reductase family protein [Candidatus Binataceae bacterium]
MDRNLARTMAALTTGIYVLTVRENERCHGMSSSWVAPASGRQPLISVAVDMNHFTRGAIERTKAFGLNIVGRRGRALEDYFYSKRARRPDNLDEIEYEPSPKLGVPWLRLAMAAIEVRVTSAYSAGDHMIFIGDPVGVRRAGRADKRLAGDRPLTSLDLEYVYLGAGRLYRRD